MPSNDLHVRGAAVRDDLARLRQSLKALLTEVGGSIGSALASRVDEPLNTLASHVEPLLALLAGGAPTKRGPGRPRKTDGLTPAPKRRGRRGGRRRKVNLTSETIEAALKASGGNKSAAARALKVSQPTFYKYLAATKVARPTPSPAPAKKPSKKRSKK